MTSAADLCAALGDHADAVEAYSYVLAPRGLSDRVCLSVLASLALVSDRSPALTELMRAVAAAALANVPSAARRKKAVAQIEQDSARYPAADDSWQPSDDSDPNACLIRDCHATGSLSLSALVALIHGALGRRASSAVALAGRYDELMTAARTGKAEQQSSDVNDIKIFSSVKTL